MKLAGNAHAKVSAAKEITLDDIKAMNDEVLFQEDHFFGQKIPGVTVSPNPIAGRLQDVADNSCLPFPYVLSPARKSLLENLLPLPGHNSNIIEGFSQAGKSNFGGHLALMYRMQKKKKVVVMYIGNMSVFKEKPHEYVFRELFYWFYEEIAEDLMIQTLILEYIKSRNQMKNEARELEVIIRRLVWLAKEKGKFIVLLVDQFNLKMDYGATEILFGILLSYAFCKVFLTTNTDTKINPFKRNDGNDSQVLVLNEIDNPIDFSQLSKVILKLFPKTKADFRDSLISEMDGNLNLVFLFYNYCASKKLLSLKNDELLQKIQEFCTAYIDENQKNHESWVKDDVEFKKQLGEMMLLVDTGGLISNFSTLLRDTRYLYYEKGRLFSINPLIQRMVQQLYWSANQIEKFLNSYGSEIGGSAFGKLFEFYLKLKIKEMNKNQKPLILKLANGKFLKLDFKQVKKVQYGRNKSEDPKSHDKEAKRFQIITYEKTSSNENVFFETVQQNFPLFEWQQTDFQNIPFHNMISVKHNGDLIKAAKAMEAFRNYAHSYGDQAKAQLGILYNIFIFLYFMILGDGVQRIIYIFYKDKKKAEDWFEKNMKALAGGIEVLFFEYRDLRKENPGNFSLNENINVGEN